MHIEVRIYFCTSFLCIINKSHNILRLFVCARGGIGRHDGFRCCHLGERFFRGSSPRTFFGKSRLACFYKRGSSVTLRHGFPRRVKTEDNKIAAGIPAAHICGYGGNGRLGGFRFLCREACGFESHYPYQRPTCIL